MSQEVENLHDPSKQMVSGRYPLCCVHIRGKKQEGFETGGRGGNGTQRGLRKTIKMFLLAIEGMNAQ